MDTEWSLDKLGGRLTDGAALKLGALERLGPFEKLGEVLVLGLFDILGTGLMDGWFNVGLIDTDGARVGDTVGDIVGF